eukprot:2591568-Karenia_brevis.AAC.1
MLQECPYQRPITDDLREFVERPCKCVMRNSSAKDRNDEQAYRDDEIGVASHFKEGAIPTELQESGQGMMTPESSDIIRYR